MNNKAIFIVNIHGNFPKICLQGYLKLLMLNHKQRCKKAIIISVMVRFTEIKIGNYF